MYDIFINAGAIAILIAGVAIYFLPTIIAYFRDLANTGVVFVINLVFGWTLLGWFLAFCWSIAGTAAHVERYAPTNRAQKAV